ncbi:hypothetical protein Tco_0797355 [Tanacetum coccineum]
MDKRSPARTVVSAKGEACCRWGAGPKLSKSDAFCHWGTRAEVLLSTDVSDISLISSNLRYSVDLIVENRDRTTAKLQNDILMFQQHQNECLSEALTCFMDLLQKFPHHGIGLWLQVQIVYNHVNPATRRTINQSASGKLRDKNAEESWALIEDLALYDNESWNDPIDFAKMVKAISLPQDVPNASDHHFIELENQVKHLMEAHLSPKPSVQVNKIASSCEICNGPHDTNYCMEILSKLLFIMYRRIPTKWEVSGSLSNSSKIFLVTPVIRHVKVTQSLGLVSNFMASQDARLSKFEADFKQQQSEMTNKIDTFLKAINDRMMGALPSNTVKNPKLNINPTSLVLSAFSYPMKDPQSSSRPLKSVNAIKTCSKPTNDFQKDQPQVKNLMVNEIGTPKPKEPEKTLEDEFKDLHLSLPVLEVLAHTPIYNAILDKYVKSLELGKNESTFVQGEIPKKIKDARLFTLPCRLGDSKPFDTLADLGSCMDLIPLYLFKNLKIGLLEETDHVFGLADGNKSYPVGIVKNVEEIARDVKLNPFKDVLMFRKMVEFLGAIPIYLKRNMSESKELIKKRIDWNKQPKEGDGAWHIKIELIDPNGEKFNRTFQSIPTIRKLSEKENPNEIIDLEHCHDF